MQLTFLYTLNLAAIINKKIMTYYTINNDAYIVLQLNARGNVAE